MVEAVEEQILTGALKVGDHLPPERELATLLGASRPAVREGLRMLEAQGVLRTVGAGPGSATVVTALPSEALTRLLRLHLALSSFRTTDVVEARVMLERRSAELAAQHAHTGGARPDPRGAGPHGRPRRCPWRSSTSSTPSSTSASPTRATTSWSPT